MNRIRGAVNKLISLFILLENDGLSDYACESKISVFGI